MHTRRHVTRRHVTRAYSCVRWGVRMRATGLVCAAQQLEGVDRGAEQTQSRDGTVQGDCVPLCVGSVVCGMGVRQRGCMTRP